MLVFREVRNVKSPCRMKKWMWENGGLECRGTRVLERMVGRSRGGGVVTLPGNSPTGEHLLCTHG